MLSIRGLGANLQIGAIMMGNEMLGPWLSQKLIMKAYDAGPEAVIRANKVGSNAPICKYSLSVQKLEHS